MSLQRAEHVVYEVVDGQAVLVGPDGDELLTLNETGTVVWQALDEIDDVEGLTARLAEVHEDVPTDRLRGDVEQFLEVLRREGLVEEDGAGT